MQQAILGQPPPITANSYGNAKSEESEDPNVGDDGSRRLLLNNRKRCQGKNVREQRAETKQNQD